MSSVPEKFAFIEACRQQFSFSSEDQFNRSISIVGLMSTIILIDHEIATIEYEFLKRHLQQTFDISEEQAQAFIGSLTDGSLHISIGEREHFQKYLKEHCDRHEKNAHLRLFFEAAAADRQITERSCVILSRIARGMGLTMSEYEIARLPYLHIIISAESGVTNERSFERTAYGYPAELEFQGNKKKLKITNISPSGFSFSSTSRFPEHASVVLILNHYFQFNANIVRTSKHRNRWHISAEFDLNQAQFLHLNRLLDIDGYRLEKSLGEEEFNQLTLIPLHLLIALREIPQYSQNSSRSLLSQYVEKHAQPPVPFIHPLMTKALENRDLMAQVEQDAIEKNLQVLRQGAALLEEKFPETIAIFVKEELCHWIVSTIAKPRGFWRSFSVDPEGRKVLESIANELNFDLSQWQFPY